MPPLNPISTCVGASARLQEDKVFMLIDAPKAAAPLELVPTPR